jgi:hypothetical protein
LTFLGKSIRKEKEIKGIQIEKEEVKFSLFEDAIILYLMDLRNYTKNLLDFINTFRKIAGYKINNQFLFYILTMNTLRKNLGK